MHGHKKPESGRLEGESVNSEQHGLQGGGFPETQTKFSLLTHPDGSSKLRMCIKCPYRPYSS